MMLETITMEDSDYSPQWPDVYVAGNKQKIEGDIRFEVVFRNRDGELEVYRPDNLFEYERYKVGALWKLKAETQSTVKPLKPIK
jgi:hypothetical protein